MGIQVEVNITRPDGDISLALLTAALEGENLAAHRLFELSLHEVPWDQGTLAESGTVIEAVNPEDGAIVMYDTPYAAHLHEHPEYHFSTKTNPGAKGKYLEDPAVENKAELGEIIAGRMRNA